MKKFILWVVAVTITLGAAVYQRLTGPTHPKRVKVELADKTYNVKLFRSHGGTEDAPIELAIDNQQVTAELCYKFFPEHENEEWKTTEFKREDTKLVAYLPNQPMAGKLMYYISLKSGDKTIEIEKNTPIVIRFKGAVPKSILFPHIFFMFFAMLLANVAGLFAIAKFSRYKLYTYLTFIFLIIGGLIFGPIVQKYAFGELWTGIPFGWDLTDNKTLFAFIFWLIAVAGNIKKDRAYLTIIAAIAVLIIFSIPHSMYGSELNRATGDVTQGFISFFSVLI
ncbi:MAG: hypothetical protein B6I20_03765 [Bacteroidetes bacterium 4572_117]|nr:MAG: hypothetical protein B6I20_03765 [Bacteroidetes bacterium 4572_117]